MKEYPYAAVKDGIVTEHNLFLEEASALYNAEQADAYYVQDKEHRPESACDCPECARILARLRLA